MLKNLKKVRYIAKVYNHEQIKEMLEILKREDKALYLGVVITSFFGLRRSELLGLKVVSYKTLQIIQ